MDEFKFKLYEDENGEVITFNHATWWSRFHRRRKERDGNGWCPKSHVTTVPSFVSGCCPCGKGIVYAPAHDNLFPYEIRLAARPPIKSSPIWFISPQERSSPPMGPVEYKINRRTPKKNRRKVR